MHVADDPGGSSEAKKKAIEHMVCLDVPTNGLDCLGLQSYPSRSRRYPDMQQNSGRLLPESYGWRELCLAH